MSDRESLVILLSRGLDDERSSVAWSIANAAIASEMRVLVFLVSSGVDWARRGAADGAHLNPFDPSMNDLVAGFRSGGGEIMVCPPCASVRGYLEDHLIEGTTLAGAPAMLEWVRGGAQTLSF